MKDKNIITVSQLNSSIKDHLEYNFHNIWLCGEISNLAIPSSGHWYFSLKDENTQVRGVMFRGHNSTTTFIPNNGVMVLVQANATMYEPRGDYQLIVNQMFPYGSGLLHQKFERLKAKLRAQGLFDQQNKKPLPSHCTTIGVVTSATGAALHDILNVLKRRNPNLQVVIYPCQVQGDDAPRQIVQMIELANLRQEVEVLIVGRGGGSLEDLWAFNEEIVAYAIFKSSLPIISAIGHEVDFTIADFVADVRASTPSVAAELVSQDLRQNLKLYSDIARRFDMALDYFLNHKGLTLQNKIQRLKAQHPKTKLYNQRIILNKLSQQLVIRIKWLLTQNLQRLNQLQRSINPANLNQKVNHQANTLQQQLTILATRFKNLLKTKNLQLAYHADSLHNLSPLQVLTRGYSITQNLKGENVKKISQIKVGDSIKTKVKDGELVSKVEKIIQS